MFDAVVYNVGGQLFGRASFGLFVGQLADDLVDLEPS